MRYLPDTFRILFFLILVSIGIPSQAQYIRGALIAGGNVTQVDGDEVFGYHKFGLQLGAAAIIQFNKKWSVSLENIFNQKGSRQSARFYTTPTDTLDGSYKLHFNYVEVPVLVQFTDKDRITVGAGISWGRLVKAEEFKNGYPVESTTLLDGPYKRDDWNILADMRFRLFSSFKLNFRYAYSIIPIATRDVIDSKTGNLNSRRQYNNILSLRLMYIFNEPPRIANEPRPAQNE
jgi:hypothetical protein